jgi:hypothetical protein
VENPGNISLITQEDIHLQLISYRGESGYFEETHRQQDLDYPPSASERKRRRQPAYCGNYREGYKVVYFYEST